MAPDDGPAAGRQSKVARLIDAYGLAGLGDELEAKWTADGDDRWSLRDLADEFNKRLLERAAEDAGVQLLDGELTNTYRLLSDGEVSDADRTRVTRRLGREGVDVDRLTADFVSYQAVRRYLKHHRGASYDPDRTDRRERASETVQRLQSRTTSVTETKLSQLRDGGQLSLGTFQVINDLRVVCEDCGNRYEVGNLLDRGECDCQ